MDLQLHKRVILVVGGTGFIGSAIVARLTEEGAIAIAASRSGEGGIVMDATDEASVQSAIDHVLSIHHRLDGVVMTAAPAAGTLDPALSSDPTQVLRATDTKALSFLRVANAALPVMTAAGFGRIVGISGQNAYVTGNITSAVRNATLLVIAKNLADSVAGSGVTVNVINPGLVTETPAADVASGRPGESSPDNAADLAAFLVSPLASAISGESISIGHRVRGVLAI